MPHLLVTLGEFTIHCTSHAKAHVSIPSGLSTKDPSVTHDSFSTFEQQHRPTPDTFYSHVCTQPLLGTMKRTHDEIDTAQVGQLDHEDDNKDDRNDEDETSEDEVRPYNAASEPPPDSPVFCEEFLGLEYTITNQLQSLCEPIVNSSYTDNIIEGLKMEIVSRTKAAFPEQVCIALLGAMQSGTC